MQILLAYGTKHGSTGEVAEAIAERLRGHDLDVDLRPASTVTDLGSYAAVVLGGSIYMGRWNPDVQKILKRHRGELAQLPVAVFGMGPQSLDEDEVASARHQLDLALQKVSEVEPVSVAIFGGVIDPAKLRFPLNKMPASDARDWDAIRAWADELAGKLSLGQVGLARVGH
jgi:menaquinone-dependent protoporphyrinogen oxidase